MNDLLFFQVFRNNFLKDYILKSINNNSLCYKRPFNEIKSLKWMILNKEYNLLVDKLLSNQIITIDSESLEVLITSCKDYYIFKLIIEKKREYLESLSRDLLYMSIDLGSLFAFESFLNIYIDLYFKENQENEKVKILNKDYFQSLIIYSLEMEQYEIVELFFLQGYQNLVNFSQNSVKKIEGEWCGVFEEIFSRKDFNKYIEFIVDKIFFDLEKVVNYIYKHNVVFGKNESVVICNIKKTNYLLSFLNNMPNDKVVEFKKNYEQFIKEKDIHFVNTIEIEELKCKVYLFLFFENYENSRKKFNKEIEIFKNEIITIEQILLKYQNLLIPYAIHYYFHNKQFDKLKSLINSNVTFIQLVILSNINFSIEGIKLCSEIRQFKFDFYKTVNLDPNIFKSVKKVDSEDQVFNFFNLIKQFENKKELIITQLYSSYEKELFIMSDYYAYNHQNNNNESNNIINNDNVQLDDLLFTFQHTSIEKYNDQILRAILLNKEPKLINIKLLASILARINNLNLNSTHQLLHELEEVYKVRELNNLNDYRDQCISIWNYLYKNQLFKNIKFINHFKWLRLLYEDFKISDEQLSTIAQLFLNQIQFSENERLKLNQELNIQLKYFSAHNLFKTFKVLLNNLYHSNNDQIDFYIEYQIYNKSKKEYLKSLTYIQKFKYGYINEEIINNLNQDQLFNIYNRRDIYNEFLANANNYQIRLFFEKLNGVLKNKRNFLINDLIKNDRFEIAHLLFSSEKNDLNSIIDISICNGRFDIIEFYLNNQLFKYQDKYTLQQLFNRSKNNDQLTLFKILLNFDSQNNNSFKKDHKLISDLINLASFNCFAYILPILKNNNIKFTLKQSNLKNNNLLIYKRSNYLFNKFLVQNK